MRLLIVVVRHVKFIVRRIAHFVCSLCEPLAYSRSTSCGHICGIVLRCIVRFDSFDLFCYRFRNRGNAIDFPCINGEGEMNPQSIVISHI
jgi:hypothetical protein